MAKVRSRTQKAALNTAVAAISEVVQLICGLILPRLIILNFGSAYNGITSSARQFLNAISILTVGVAGATRVALYKSLEENDNKKTSSIIKATDLYMRKVGCALFVFVVLLTVFYPIFTNTGYSWIEVAPLVVAAGISASGRYFFGTAYMALLSADQSVYISKAFLIIANILNVIISVILIKAGCNVQIVKLASAFILFLNPLARALYCRKKYNLTRNIQPDNSALSMRRDVMAHSIANMVHDYTDVLVLTIFCDIRIVSVYMVYNLVMNALKMTQGIFTGGTEAIFGNMWVRGENKKIKSSLGSYEYIISAFVSVIFSTTLIMILPFISLYTKGVHDVEYILPSYAIVIILAQMFFSFRTPYQTLVQGAGHYKQTKQGAYAEAAINMILSVVFVQFLGIVGVAIGTLAANIFRTVQYALYTDKHLVSRGKTVFIKRIVWAIGNVLLIALITYRYASTFAYKNWMGWVVAAVAVTLVSITVTLVSSFVFYKKDLQAVIMMVKHSIGSKALKKN